MTTSGGDIKDSNLSKAGVDRINWAAKEMPVLEQIRQRFKKERPLDGLRISACLHVTSETANLAITLMDGGALVNLCASNPLSTQDEVAAALDNEYQIPTFAIKGEDDETYYTHIRSVLNHRPQITMDDGADLVAMVHQERRELINGIIGGTEETTTGVIRLRAMSEAGKLEYPIVAVNEADTKHLFDNRYGTGQSTLDGITRATNLLWAGRKVVVMGYGWCGRGVASRARGMGANVIVTEIDPTKALEAIMDGFTVLHSDDAARVGEVFITVTGGLKTISKRTIELMQNGAIMANSGHFNVEIDIPALQEMANSVREVRPMVKEYSISHGKSVYLLGDGRLINLSAAEGHPSSVMDMSFANQALSVEYLLKESANLTPKVYSVPDEMDREVGRLKLLAMGVKIDTLSDEQVKYINSWEEGT
ncbi:adenosylhomocysteinase [SAR202 cluster bacterium AC-409-J13_OGT_754m]|nr:adenosylhomocysteinase [SAR202 cluster bacterium AC-409-J13_OGT_754m]